MSIRIFLLLGTNLGDRRKNLRLALAELEHERVCLVRESSLYETAAWGNTNQPPFLNQALEVSSSLKPEPFLQLVLSIEKNLGRVRTVKWGERIIDIDILYYSDTILNSKDLTIPHAGIPARRFVLEPLSEIAPDFVHPVLQKTNLELLQICTDQLVVSKIS